MQYLQNDDKAGRLGATGCIFCDLPADNRDAENLIVHRDTHVFVILNRYPYNNGHLMVVPFTHAPSLEQLDVPTLTQLMTNVNQALATLRSVYNPHGFNLGVNIGGAAGAGIAAHVHFHVVPRWAGDTNFMTTVSESRVLPDELHTTHQKISTAWHTA
jgi:ATP adenylyltransferase